MGIVELHEEVALSSTVRFCDLCARWFVDLYQKGLQLARKRSMAKKHVQSTACAYSK